MCSLPIVEDITSFVSRADVMASRKSKPWAKGVENMVVETMSFLQGERSSTELILKEVIFWNF